jgi:hypothetical protein
LRRIKADIRVTLFQQIKVKQVYMFEHLAAFRRLCTDSEWETFAKNLDGTPWRFCRVVPKGGNYDLRCVVLPVPDVKSRVSVPQGPIVSAPETAALKRLLPQE